MADFYILIKDFEKLKIGQEEALKVFRSDPYDSKRISEYETKPIKKLDNASFETGGKTYELEYRSVDAERITHRTPHHLIKKEWNDRVKQMAETIAEEENKLNKYVNDDLKGIRTNLFVSSDYAEVVTTKIAELHKELEGMRLRLEQLKDYYDNIKDDSNETPVIREKSAD